MVATTPNVDAVVASVQRLRVHAIVAEVDLHRAIARQLAADGIEASHEVVLGPRCRIDFLTVDGVGIEVKRGRTWGAKVRAQVGRYLAFDRVRALVLVTEQAVHGRFTDVWSKPFRVVSTTKQWGIAT